MTGIKRLQRTGMLALAALLTAGLSYAAPVPQEKATQQAKDTTRKAGNAIKDSWITMKVHSQFVPEDTLEGSDIDVETKNGTVMLMGTVPTEAGRARAVAIAKATDGVVNVTEHLRIAAAASTTAGAREAGRNAANETKDAARKTGDAAREATGTTGRTMSDGWIKSKIAAQYVTEDSLDNSDIDIDISKGMVTLNGAVRTAGARTRAAEIATKTEGVKNVKNNLKVDPSVK
jgi:hyperosmotically inducible periplasmic protein